jgi:hypothetical protein
MFYVGSDPRLYHEQQREPECIKERVSELVKDESRVVWTELRADRQERSKAVGE